MTLRRPTRHFGGYVFDLDGTLYLGEHLLPGAAGLDAGSADAFRTAVAYVGGMTDRYACRQALALLGWQRDRLPVGIDV